MVLLVLFCLAVWQGTETSPSHPSRDEFARRVHQGFERDYEVQKHFTYLEHRRDVKISRLGKVTIGPLRTFEVLPSERGGGAYKRLIAIEGKPLSAAERAERDAEHERDVRKAAARDRSETPAQRANRLAKEAEAHRRREALLTDAFAVYEPTLVGRETIDGQQVLVADLHPRADAQVTTREGTWMKNFSGRLWVAESDYRLVKLDMRAFEDITIAWGVIGRVHKGSRVLFTRRRFENAWLPATMTYEAAGRTLLFRTFQFSVTTTYSDYKRRAAE